VRVSDFVRRLLLCLAPAALGGCYTYAYAPTTPAPGVRLALDLNDLGRYQMAEHVGPGIARVDGWVISCNDSEYTLRAERTIGVTGGTTPWNGEQVVVRKSWVGIAREKHFSPQRTAVLATTVTAGFVVFLATRGLLGIGNGSPDTPGGTGGGTNGT
jgi:hypothetical protein